MCEHRDAFRADGETCEKCGWRGDTSVCRTCGKPGETKDLGAFVVPATAKEEDKLAPVLLPLVRPVYAVHGLLGVDEDHKPTLVETQALLAELGISRPAERWIWVQLLGVITAARAVERQRTVDALTESRS